MGICPKCEAPLDRVRLEQVNVEAVAQNWVGVAYSCPFCFGILSVSIDPIAIKTDIVDEIVEQLRRR